MQLPWYRFLFSLKEKYLSVIAGSLGKKKKERKKMPRLILMIKFQRGREEEIIRHLIPSGPLTYYSSTLWSNEVRKTSSSESIDYMHYLS